MQFKDLSWLTQTLRISYVIAIAASLKSLFRDLQVLWILNAPQRYELTPGSPGWPYGVSTLSLLGTMFTFVLLFVWVFKSHQNAKRISPDAITSPVMAVVNYYIPILAFYKPYQNMQEIWKICTNPTQWRSERGSSLVAAWWWVYVLRCIAVVISKQIDPVGNSSSLKAFQIYYTISASAELLNVIFCGLAAILVGRLWERMKVYAP